MERLCSLKGRTGIVAGLAICHFVGRGLAIEGIRRHGQMQRNQRAKGVKFRLSGIWDIAVRQRCADNAQILICSLDPD
ncbi:hypothetical protein [Paramagnetospirillum magnetotacticum]|uniref:hypothetical protein n=1 Tax=Paramagnetospirillum magnetotacticum TaxID=188 RepID=UPI001269FBEE|nr:hypothetical protein [Paramagnetospirillum magnetotacticum]